MNNISLRGEDLELVSGKKFYVIDALYLNVIKSELNELQKNSLEKEIKEKVFPFTDAPFALLQLSNDIFQVRKIKKVSYEDISDEDKNCFVSDTGLILLVEESIFSSLVKNCSYDELVDAGNDEINLNYWEKLTRTFPLGSVGLILSPGIDSGYEFVGGGVYKIY